MDLDELLDSPLKDSPEESYAGAISNAAKIRKNKYHMLHQYANVSSYSTQSQLHACPRLFSINKLRMHQLVEQDLPEHRYANITFAFGHAVGAGVAALDAGQTLGQAILATFLAWDIDLTVVERRNYRGKLTETGKSFPEAVWAVKLYDEFRRNELDSEVGILDYDVLDNEAEILVEFNDGHFYAGHVDSILRSRTTGRLKVKENKTDGSLITDPAKFANSEQALSYAAVAQVFDATDFDVLYTIYNVKEMRWVYFEFPKYTFHKAEWIQDQRLIHSAVNNYASVGMFPKRGQSCFRFNRQCELFGRCDIDSRNVFGREFATLPAAQLSDLLQIEEFKYRVHEDEIVSALVKEVTAGKMSRPSEVGFVNTDSDESGTLEEI